MSPDVWFPNQERTPRRPVKVFGIPKKACETYQNYQRSVRFVVHHDLMRIRSTQPTVLEDSWCPTRGGAEQREASQTESLVHRFLEEQYCSFYESW